MDNANDLKLILDSRIPLVVIETHEEKKALDMLLRTARQQGKDLQRWSVTDGLARIGFGPQLVPQGTTHSEPGEVLMHIKARAEAGLFALCDMHPFLDQPQLVRLIKDIALNHLAVPHTLVFLSHKLKLPPELLRYSATFSLSLPSDERIMAIIREEAKNWSDRNSNVRVKTDNVTLRKLVANLQGLSVSDVRRLVRIAIWQDGAITEADIPAVNKAKFELLDMEGVMSFEYETADFSQVGGLANLKRWLNARKAAFIAEGNGNLDPPRGIMLLGVQGGGKSLAAKAVAGTWGLPLLRLDMGALYNKYHGETERNLREALKMADAMAPCVLWMDEIEKAMSRSDNDGGTSQRVLGTLLTWMAERKNRVFLTATSNDISRLPPELIRKGRLDEIFFVDFPDEPVRRIIFDIHLKKRGLDPAEFDLEQLSAASEGFSGAEIEQAVVAACYSAAAQGGAMNTEQLLREINDTSPLSVVMAEQIQQLRHWAAERTVPA